MLNLLNVYSALQAISELATITPKIRLESFNNHATGLCKLLRWSMPFTWVIGGEKLRPLHKRYLPKVWRVSARPII